MASGDYATASEVMRAGLRALQEWDAVVERWLRVEIVPTLDTVRADFSSAIPIDQVMDTIRAHHAERLKKRA